MDTLPGSSSSGGETGSSTAPSGIPNSDQCFLLCFIFGLYFGPDLKRKRLKKSVFQRMAEGLPPYSHNELAGSFMKTVQVERVYYYILRYAESLMVKLSMLHQFFQGNLPVHGGGQTHLFLQFPSLFPPQLHPHLKIQDRYEIVGNILFIDNPETFFFRPKDIERFKRLTGLDSLRMDRGVALFHASVDANDLYIDSSILRSLAANDPVAPVNRMPYSASPLTQANTAALPTEDDSRALGKSGPAMIFLPSCPDKEELKRALAFSKDGLALTGSAALGKLGPTVGLLDIEECDDSYLFRVSLPGVKRDEKEFSCELQCDGTVVIKGVTTTGESTVHRFSQVFEMQSRNLCPLGEFSIKFKLPGPVIPQQFSGHYGVDGILEGIVLKRGHPSLLSNSSAVYVLCQSCFICSMLL